MNLEKAVDQAIAAENRRFLDDPGAIADAHAEGALYAKRLGLDDDQVEPTTWSVTADDGSTWTVHRSSNPTAGQPWLVDYVPGFESFPGRGQRFRYLTFEQALAGTTQRAAYRSIPYQAARARARETLDSQFVDAYKRLRGSGK